MANPVSVLVRAVRGLLSLGAGKSGEAATGREGASDSASGPAAPGVDRAAGLQQLRDGMEEIRKSLRSYGSAVAALATAVLSGLGYTTLHSLFPVPAGNSWITPVAVIFCAFAVTGSLWLVGKFFAAQRRIVFAPSRLSPAPDTSQDRLASRLLTTVRARRRSGLSSSERTIVESVLREHANEESAASARALELRALRLARLARRLEPGYSDAVGPVQREADRLDSALAMATLRASLSVLERRSHQVFSGQGGVRVALLAAAGSVIGLVLISDYSKGQRDLIALRKACAEAKTAGALNGCDTVTRAPTGTPTPTPSASASVQPAEPAILTRLQTCAEALGPAPVPAPLVERALAACAGLPPVTPQAAQTGSP